LFSRTFIVRRATENDVEEIAHIAAAGWRHTYGGLISPQAIEDTLGRWYSTEMLVRRFAGPPLHLAESDGEVVGYVQHGPVGESIHEVYAIYVKPSLLGKGIGWALWEQVARDARDGGKSAIELWVLDGNRLGIDWYDRHGGHVVGQREIALADGTHTELRYRFDLKTS
jgi:ribosomal protein S18 acetylase RimI-like enzyme